MTFALCNPVCVGGKREGGGINNGTKEQSLTCCCLRTKQYKFSARVSQDPWQNQHFHIYDQEKEPSWQGLAGATPISMIFIKDYWDCYYCAVMSCLNRISLKFCGRIFFIYGLFSLNAQGYDKLAGSPKDSFVNIAIYTCARFSEFIREIYRLNPHCALDILREYPLHIYIYI